MASTTVSVGDVPCKAILSGYPVCVCLGLTGEFPLHRGASLLTKIDGYLTLCETRAHLSLHLLLIWFLCPPVVSTHPLNCPISDCLIL